jgi:hypothetical protein
MRGRMKGMWRWRSGDDGVMRRGEEERREAKEW